MRSIDEMLGIDFIELIAKLQDDPLNTEYLHELADYYFFQSDEDGQRTILEQIIKIEPENSLAYLRLADSYKTDENVKEEIIETLLLASVKYAESHEADPHSALGDLYLDQEKTADAVAQHESAFFKCPTLLNRINLGHSYLKDDQIDLAKIFLEASYDEAKARCESGQDEKIIFTMSANLLEELYQAIGRDDLARKMREGLAESSYNFNKAILT